MSGCRPAPLPLLLLLTLLLAVTAAVAQPARPAIVVDVVAPRLQPMPRTIGLVGSLHARNDIEVASQVDGKVTALAFTEGQPVAAGALLIELDEDIYRAELNQARASLELAQLRYDRAQRLLKQQAASQSAVDEARAELSARQAALELAEVRLAKTRITAPFGGVVGISEVATGDYITAGEPLVGLVDYRNLSVDFRAPESALRELERGTQLEFSVDSLGGVGFTAAVTAIEPRVSAASRSLWVRAAVTSDANLLRPGMFARLQLTLGENQPRLTLPEEALLASRTGYRVFVVEDGLARLRPVEIGLRRGGAVVIEAGLEPDSTVVTTGQLKLYEGAPVEIRNRQSLATDALAPAPPQVPKVAATLAGQPQ